MRWEEYTDNVGEQVWGGTGGSREGKLNIQVRINNARRGASPVRPINNPAYVGKHNGSCREGQRAAAVWGNNGNKALEVLARAGEKAPPASTRTNRIHQ